jgi:hypothetical protein
LTSCNSFVGGLDSKYETNLNIVFETAKVDAKYKTNTKTDLLFLMHQGVYSDWILTGYMAFWHR